MRVPISFLIFEVLIAACSSSARTTTDVTTDAGAEASADTGGSNPPGCMGVSSQPGGPCSCNNDCQPGDTCDSELESGEPGGFCVHFCSTATTPAAGLFCKTQGPGDNVLVPTCDATNRCRDAYVCMIDAISNVGTCWAQCSSDSQCPITGHCDLYSGFCQPEAAGSGLNQPCTGPEQCKSGVCLLGSPRYCASKCDTTTSVCAEGAICESISNNPGYTSGVCLLPCMSGACPSGFTCDSAGACFP